MEDKAIKDRLEKMHINCYKLFLCNIEMKYLFEEAELEDRQIYGGNLFLRFSIENIHIRFCLLAGILISENEEYSITKFTKDFLEEGETKRGITEVVYNEEFQKAWKRIKKLRDKCYAHNDREEGEISNEIQLTQKERNYITDGLTKSMISLYSDFLSCDLVSFQNEEPRIKSTLRVIKEWKSFLIQDTQRKINESKKSMGLL
jgi:hypothetical protein